MNLRKILILTLPLIFGSFMAAAGSKGDPELKTAKNRLQNTYGFYYPSTPPPTSELLPVTPTGQVVGKEELNVGYSWHLALDTEKNAFQDSVIQRGGGLKSRSLFFSEETFTAQELRLIRIAAITPATPYLILAEKASHLIKGEYIRLKNTDPSSGSAFPSFHIVINPHTMQDNDPEKAFALAYMGEKPAAIETIHLDSALNGGLLTYLDYDEKYVYRKQRKVGTHISTSEKIAFTSIPGSSLALLQEPKKVTPEDRSVPVLYSAKIGAFSHEATMDHIASLRLRAEFADLILIRKPYLVDKNKNNKPPYTYFITFFTLVAQPQGEITISNTPVPVRWQLKATTFKCLLQCSPTNETTGRYCVVKGDHPVDLYLSPAQVNAEGYDKQVSKSGRSEKSEKSEKSEEVSDYLAPPPTASSYVLTFQPKALQIQSSSDSQLLNQYTMKIATFHYENETKPLRATPTVIESSGEKDQVLAQSNYQKWEALKLARAQAYAEYSSDKDSLAGDHKLYEAVELPVERLCILTGGKPKALKQAPKANSKKTVPSKNQNGDSKALEIARSSSVLSFKSTSLPPPGNSEHGQTPTTSSVPSPQLTTMITDDIYETLDLSQRQQDNLYSGTQTLPHQTSSTSNTFLTLQPKTRHRSGMSRTPSMPLPSTPQIEKKPQPEEKQLPGQRYAKNMPPIATKPPRPPRAGTSSWQQNTNKKAGSAYSANRVPSLPSSGPDPVKQTKQVRKCSIAPTAPGYQMGNFRFSLPPTKAETVIAELPPLPVVVSGNKHEVDYSKDTEDPAPYDFIATPESMNNYGDFKYTLEFTPPDHALGKTIINIRRPGWYTIDTLNASCPLINTSQGLLSAPHFEHIMEFKRVPDIDLYDIYYPIRQLLCGNEGSYENLMPHILQVSFLVCSTKRSMEKVSIVDLTNWESLGDFEYDINQTEKWISVKGDITLKKANSATPQLLFSPLESLEGQLSSYDDRLHIARLEVKCKSKPSIAPPPALKLKTPVVSEDDDYNDVDYAEDYDTADTFKIIHNPPPPPCGPPPGLDDEIYDMYFPPEPSQDLYDDVEQVNWTREQSLIFTHADYWTDIPGIEKKDEQQGAAISFTATVPVGSRRMVAYQALRSNQDFAGQTLELSYCASSPSPKELTIFLMEVTESDTSAQCEEIKGEGKTIRASDANKPTEATFTFTVNSEKFASRPLALCIMAEDGQQMPSAGDSITFSKLELKVKDEPVSEGEAEGAASSTTATSTATPFKATSSSTALPSDSNLKSATSTTAVQLSANAAIKDEPGELVHAYSQTGYKPLISAEAFSVKTAGQYCLKVKVRQSTDGNKNGKFYAGVACLDKDHQKIGNYRYCAVNGRRLEASEGWLSFEGSIGGQAALRSSSLKKLSMCVLCVS